MLAPVPWSETPVPSLPLWFPPALAVGATLLIVTVVVLAAEYCPSSSLTRKFTVNEHGYLRIVDRTKDLIKSGGEWISSVDLENAIVGFPGIREAAVIAVPHPKWEERPLAIIVATEPKPKPDELDEFLAKRFAKWQLPDAYIFVEELPHTSTGKLLKSALRDRYRDYLNQGFSTAN